jgi:hypothetical protein
MSVGGNLKHMFDREVKVFNIILAAVFIVITFGAINLSEMSMLRVNLPLVLILLMLLTSVTSVSYTIRHERKKIFGERIKDQLRAMGYSLINERPLTIQERLHYLDWTPRFTTFENDIPIGWYKYRSKNYRILKVKDSDNRELDICTSIVVDWSDQIQLDVVKKFG